jgi:hypothetical protein
MSVMSNSHSSLGVVISGDAIVKSAIGSLAFPVAKLAASRN